MKLFPSKIVLIFITLFVTPNTSYSTIGEYECAVAQFATSTGTTVNGTYSQDVFSSVGSYDVYGVTYPLAVISTIPPNTSYHNIVAEIKYYVWSGTTWAYKGEVTGGHWKATSGFISSWNESGFFEAYVNSGQHPSSVYPNGCADMPNPCDDARALKELECGGAEFLEIDEWDDENCTGTCKCDGPSEVSANELDEFCGEKHSDFIFDPESCQGECTGDCTFEYNSLEQECGIAGIQFFDESTCAGMCNPPSCQQEISDKEIVCSGSGVNLTTWNYTLCTGECRTDCTSEYNALTDKCGITGIAQFDDDTCSGICKDCDYERSKCNNTCSGFISSFDCNEVENSSGDILGIDLGACVCIDPVDRYIDLGGATGEVSADDAGFYGGVVTSNPDGSKTETLSNGNTIIYNNSTVERPRGSLVYTNTSSGEVQEHWTDADGIEHVISYNPDTGYATETESFEKDGAIYSTSTVLTDYNPLGEISSAGEITTELSEEAVEPVTGEEITEDEYEPEGDATDYVGRIDFSPLVGSVSQFSGVYPFAIVNNISTLVDKINVSPVTPSWTIDIIPAKYNVAPIEIELSSFDGVAEVVRWFLSLGLWAVAIWACIKIWTR